MSKVPIYPLCSSMNVITTCVILFLRMKISIVGVLLAIRELGKPSLVIIYFISFHNNVKQSYITNLTSLQFSSVRREFSVRSKIIFMHSKITWDMKKFGILWMVGNQWNMSPRQFLSVSPIKATTVALISLEQLFGTCWYGLGKRSICVGLSF